MIHRPIEVSVYFFLRCASLLSHVRLFVTLWAVAYQTPLRVRHGDSPGENNGVGCFYLLQGIFPTQESNSVSHIAGRCFTDGATREALFFVLVFIHSFHYEIFHTNRQAYKQALI